jgi:hypothetical protein
MVVGFSVLYLSTKNVIPYCKFWIHSLEVCSSSSYFKTEIIRKHPLKFVFVGINHVGVYKDRKRETMKIFLQTTF